MSYLSAVGHLVILAGGKGARLAPVAGDLPKVLVNIGGKPVLQHQLELAEAAGIREVTIFAGHHAHKLLEFVGDGSRFDLSVHTAIERRPMGSAGAFLRSLDSLPEHCFVLYGDLMLAVDLGWMARKHIDREADFTSLSHPNDHPHDSDLLEIDGNDWVTAIHACPHPPNAFFDNLVNAGLYVVRRDALRPWAAVQGMPDFAKNIMPELLAKHGRVLAHRSSEYVKDMGTPDRLKRVEADWQAGKISLQNSNRWRPAVFLDRDGTLNVEHGHLGSPDGVELLPGVAVALRSLRDSGFQLVVVSNQPVVARGEATEADVAAVNRRLKWELGKEGAYLDAIYVCPHHPDGGFPGERTEFKILCNCRKPNVGLLERACRDMRIDLANSWMVGDQTRDIETARKAGLRSILVETGWAGRDALFASNPDYIAGDLIAAADIIVHRQQVVAR